MKAPDFSLVDQKGEHRSLKDFKGKWIILYFYPKDDTPDCTSEACSFRDDYSVILNEGAVVLGVSMDSQESHKKFGRKYRLNFAILSDPSGKVVREYKAWGKKAFGREGILRKTFIITPKGEIAKVYEKVKAAGHAGEVLNDLRSLKQAINGGDGQQ